MAQATLDQILIQVKTLDLKELQKLSQVVQDYLAPQNDADKLSAFHKSLLDSGLIRKIRSPSLVLRDRQLMQIEGKPYSETIIEERR